MVKLFRVDEGIPTLAMALADEMWGADDMAFFSRYDGLLYFRINGLGAYCVGTAESYAPAPVEVKPVLRVLPNLEVAAIGAELEHGEWIRAWMTLRLWQDGIGAVPDRDSRDNPTRIDPDHLRNGRQLLVWALTRVAHGGNEDWLDLETFLLDLYAASGERGLSFYWEGFTWQPRFALAACKEDLERGPERTRAFWMDREGVWAANALLSTFVYLGVVERGRSGGARSTRWSFRLTEVGKAVFHVLSERTLTYAGTDIRSTPWLESLAAGERRLRGQTSRSSGSPAS